MALRLRHPWQPPPGFGLPNLDAVPIAAPGNRNIYCGRGHMDRRCVPYCAGGQHWQYPGRNPYRAADPTGFRGLTSLTDRLLESTGDLGWTVDYATAWLYRHLNNSRTHVADAIDHIRESFDTVASDHAFMVFDLLDTTIFAGKLKGMVYMQWTMQPSCSPGRTSAPNVVPGIPRIVVELNQGPFDDGNGAIDELLEVLIHQMIHAYFIVCCGAQRRGDKADGRLQDGKHFAVILMAIRGISKECEDGELELIFHASKRRQRNMGLAPAQAAMSTALTAAGGRDPYLAINPAGVNLGGVIVENQTNCMRDNRHITPGDVQNWQMLDFGRSLALEMEAKGAKVWAFSENGKLIQMDRTKCPPSVTSIEMLWDDRGSVKRVLAKREKALDYKSLEKPLKKNGRFELIVPGGTNLETLKCLWDFISKGDYCATPLDKQYHLPVTRGRGPPVLYAETPHVGAYGAPMMPNTSILTHIQVFKAAERMKFVELQKYALTHMWNVPATCENPMLLLYALYNMEQNPDPRPISAELHKWARQFLAARERDGTPPHLAYAGRNPPTLHRHRAYAGYSNLHKIVAWHPERVQHLYHGSPAFQDDVQQAKLLLRTGAKNALTSRAHARQRLMRDTATAALAITGGIRLGDDILDGGFGRGGALPNLSGLGINTLDPGLEGLNHPLRGGRPINLVGGIGTGAALGAIGPVPGLDPYIAI